MENTYTNFYAYYNAQSFLSMVFYYKKIFILIKIILNISSQRRNIFQNMTLMYI